MCIQEQSFFILVNLRQRICVTHILSRGRGALQSGHARKIYVSTLCNAISFGISKLLSDKVLFIFNSFPRKLKSECLYNSAEFFQTKVSPNIGTFRFAHDIARGRPLSGFFVILCFVFWVKKNNPARVNLVLFQTKLVEQSWRVPYQLGYMINLWKSTDAQRMI